MKTIPERTFEFGVEIIKFTANLPRNAAGFAITSQLVRSGTSVGANVEEAQDSLTKKDFIHTMTIALKEARETNYWLKVIKETKLVEADVDWLIDETIQIVRILTTSVKKAKTRL
jgi:four helix bundle protein